MDKLQPVIRQRYWICFGFAVIFVTVGWWIASGSLAAATDARKKSVDDSFAKAKNGVTDPNENWVAAAKKRNEADQAAKQSASRLLWQRQKSARKWPTVLEAELSNIPYFDQIKSNTARARWARNYPTQIEQLLEIVKPFKNTTGEGLVIVGLNNISHKPFRSWRTGPPASAEIWNNQEDIWLLQSLLTSIAKVNEGATRLSDSQVRQINRLHLRGGDPAAPPTSAMGGGMEMGGMSMGGMSMGGMSMSGMGGGEDTAMGMGGMSMGGVGGLNSAGVPNPAKAFEGNPGNDILAEEYGAVAGAGGLGGSPMGSMDSMAMGERMSSAGGAEAMGGGGAAAPAEEVRYVDQKEGLYKTRAFLLDVVVRDDQVPNLLASLTNSDFPVEIVRVDISAGVKSGSGGSGGEMMTSMSGESDDAVAGGMSPGMGEMMTPGGMSSMNGLGSDPAMGMSMGAGLGMPGEGLGMGSEYGSGGLATGSSAATRGAEVYQAAMSDPLLVTVKIGGLMTLYQSLEEAQQQEATEDAAVTEQSAAPATPIEPGETEIAGEAAVGDGSEAVAADPATVGAVPATPDPTAAAVDSAADSSAAPAVVPDTGTPATIPPAEGVPAGEAQPPADPGAVKEPGVTENGDSGTSVEAVPSSDPGGTPSPN